MKFKKRGQVTIFIIVAIVIVALILIYIGTSDNGRKIINQITGAKPPVTEDIKSCFENNPKIDLKINTIMSQGGLYNPQNFILHNNTKFEYLCYSDDYLRTCYVQKPLLIRNVEAEISKQIKPEIQDCISEIEDSLRNKGYEVISKPLKDVYINISADKLKINIKYSLSAKKGSDVVAFESVGFEKNSKAYDLIMISTSIMSSEAVYGDSEIYNLMLLYPNIRIDKTRKDDGSKIYIITERNTKEKFGFAVRSLVYPPGYIKS